MYLFTWVEKDSDSKYLLRVCDRMYYRPRTFSDQIGDHIIKGGIHQNTRMYNEDNAD